MRKRVTRKQLESKLAFVNDLLEAAQHPRRLWYKTWPSGLKTVYWHEGDRDIVKVHATSAQRIGLCFEWLYTFGEGLLCGLVHYDVVWDRLRTAAPAMLAALEADEAMVRHMLSCPYCLSDPLGMCSTRVSLAMRSSALRTTALAQAKERKSR